MRKRRTRNHIIADLSANYVERFALLCGYTVERVLHDYGVDLLLYTYNDEGEVENDTVKIQLKATDQLSILQDGETIAFSVSRSDLDYWLGEWQPVILIVYDAQAEAAYWLYIQAYFEAQTEIAFADLGATFTLHLDKTSFVETETFRQFARYKADIIRQRPKDILYVL